jgi:hypothetical protein
MRQGASVATNGASWGRRSLFFRMARPRASTPKIWKTSFARSIPITATSIVYLLGLESAQRSHARRGAVHPIRWRREYGGLRVDQARRLKELERENARLKKLVADQALDVAILRETAKGNF